jgi:hypothetical protein
MDTSFSPCFPDIDSLFMHIDSVDKDLRFRFTGQGLGLHKKFGFPFCLDMDALICRSILYGAAVMHIRSIDQDLFSAPASKLIGNPGHPRCSWAGFSCTPCSGL